MKIMFVCAGGMSTSILMKKMEKYAAAQGIELEIMARGVGDYLDVAPQFDCILLGPQIGYQLDNVKSASGKPCGVMKPQDYAIGNCANIMKLAHEVSGK